MLDDAWIPRVRQGCHAIVPISKTTRVARGCTVYRIIWDNPPSARPGLSESTVFPTRINFDPTYLIRQIGFSPGLAPGEFS